MDGSYKLIEGLLIGIVLVFVVIEIALNFNDDQGDTSNVILYDWSCGKFFFIPFCLGAIGGHLFLGTSVPILQNVIILNIPSSELSVIILFIICGVMTLIGYNYSFPKTKLFISAILALGILYGHFFWSMNH